MQKLGLNEIREKYLSFFESKDHLRLPSFPLVPKNDPSILLINAGMTPLKPYFTGKETPPRKRVTTCQKCIRTPDIELVGKTARHGTFFEMLGNFSFGDYFKDEAIAWAWEFITKVMEMSVDKLWVTIYESDDQAFDIWTKKIGVDPERVVRMGKEDNFWEHGTGPCGPCSEIHFDRGEEYGCHKPGCKIGCDCDRYVEFWNLVFTQFDKDEKGNYNPLPKPNIDTGMGLERLAVIMQGVNNLFEVDTIRNIMLAISDYTGVKYGDNDKTDVSLRVITDHIRSTCFMISDGIIPSNEGRGYVLRRLLRRAARHGKLLGVNGPFLYKIADTVFAECQSAYPELEQHAEYIKKIIKIEEERFCETVDQGLAILASYIDDIKKAGKTVLDGQDAFKLYDTYGFPIDLTIDIAAESALTVDKEGFDKCMQNQRATAKAARAENADNAWSKDISLPDEIKPKFLGYDALECEAAVTALIKDGEFVDKVSEGDNATVIFDKTVFYSESGGQIGDTGTITADTVRAVVTNSIKMSGKHVSLINIESGELSKGDKVTLVVNKKRRMAISRNHSTTHLLQKALKEVLGVHVAQSGSYVDEERLRFDFSHFEPMTKEQLTEVEKKVNEKILEGLLVTKKEMPIDEARKLGATALFGEKYGEVVRVVTMGDYSMEFCGGTHLDNTSEAGLFKIVSESGIAAGIRRIEGVTGSGVLNYIYEKEETIETVAQLIKSSPSAVVERAKAYVEKANETKKTLEKLQTEVSKNLSGNLLENAKEIKGVTVVTASLKGITVEQMREMIDNVKTKLDTAAIVLASDVDGKVFFVGNATKGALDKGVHIGMVIKQVAAIAGGGGGGKPDSAQAGGRFVEKIDEALASVENAVESQIK
ncbi:MAG: alanine--tRNA ligase [Bacillota bacterium]|nr:alanine--tRNA ligase [Bacillota bacterium]